ncbi:MAG: hypothetical protein KIT09_33015 [Bryobacteraceae bacterium]|nr:hypothetical protein [Bryobacteraceae bacterium]
MRILMAAALSIPALALTACSGSEVSADKTASRAGAHLQARAYNSGFELAHQTYNGISPASDGNIYYVLCSESIDTGAQMYCYNPAADSVRHVGDLTEACGEKGSKAIVHGKSHVPFFESNGKLYFATHVGYYTVKGGRELMGVPPPGYKPYPGGHFLAYDLKTGKFENLAKAPQEHGIITMTMDPGRGRLYGITWPNGYFLRYDLASKDLKNLGAISQEGEAGSGPAYRTLCRSMVVNPGDGSVYFTTSEGDIHRYRYDHDALEKIEGEDLRKDYFGSYDPTSPGHMGYNWRQAVWYPKDKAIYAVHGNSGYLFRYDPAANRVDVVERITAEPSRRSGMFDKFYYGYLGFALGPDESTLHYLTGGAIYQDGRPLAARTKTQVGARGEENLHLVTYDIPAGAYRDHGPIFFDGGGRPTYVNSIAVGRDGAVYAIANIPDNGRTRTDLIKVPGPLARK